MSKSPAMAPSSGPAAASPAEDSRPRHEVYKLPAPIRTIPLPTFNPSNPISLLHLAWTWASQVFFPPPAEPSTVWEGVWSPTSRSVHVVDQKAIRALWEQGFYGKGSLSRSEPNWLKREKVRRGLVQSHVSEEMTLSRREERVKMKWERARLEQEAIRQTRLEEARLAAARKLGSDLPSVQPTTTVAFLAPAAPVGPSQLLALPNSLADLVKAVPTTTSDPVHVVKGAGFEVEDTPPLAGNPIEQASTQPPASGSGDLPNGVERNGIINGAPNSSSASDTSDEQKTLKRRKSVRFSPKVESATFEHTDPPSPNHALLNGGANGNASKPRLASLSSDSNTKNGLLNGVEHVEPTDEIVDKEHLQLTAEEAFFLHFGLGCLKVKQPSGKEAIETADLFKILRQDSEFPPQDENDLRPDDSFLVNYAVYHHFRSLGWVPRPGIKFAMDWMLYAKGPVFDHAEFGVIIMPSYSDSWWKQNGTPKHEKTWHWLHGVVRVLSHVMKSLVLVYVDVPPPPAFDEALEKGPAEVFKLYKIREVMVKRWSSNRNR